MSATPQPENYRDEYNRSLSKGNGSYWPEEVFPLAVETANQFRKITQDIYSDVANGLYGSPKLRKTILHLGDAALMTSWVIKEGIPAASLKKLEKDRLNLVEAEQTVTDPFWHGENLPERPPARHGMIADWLTTTISHFQNRPLSYEDLAKILYAEDFNKFRNNYLNTKISSRFKSESGIRSLEKRLPPNLEIKVFTVKPAGTFKRVTRLVCVPAESADTPINLDESNRPTDYELRDLAVRVRQEELAQRKTDNVQTEEMEFDSSRLARRDHKLFFRSNIRRLLTKSPLLRPQKGHSGAELIFEIKSGEEILAKLFERGIITQAQLEGRKFDRATMVAATLIKADADEGFLSAEEAAKGLEIIREEEANRLEELRFPGKKSKKGKS